MDNVKFATIPIAALRTLLEEAEKVALASGAHLRPILRKDGIIMELTASDEFGVDYTGGRHFNWVEIAAMRPPAIVDAMRWAAHELRKKVSATTE